MYTAILLVVILLVLQFWKSWNIGRNPAYLAGALVMVILVGYTGHLGGQMIHKKAPAAPPAKVEAVQK